MYTFLITALCEAHAIAEWDVKHPGEYIDHLKTTVPAIRLEGLLFDRDGERCGLFALLDGNNFAEVDRWIALSPYQLAGLYRRVEVHQVRLQAGSLS